MLAGFVRDRIFAYLGDYISVDNERLEKIAVSLWNGTLEIEDIHAKKDVLKKLFGIPYDIHDGRIRKLLIRVPWNALQSQPVVVSISGVKITASSIQSDDDIVIGVDRQKLILERNEAKLEQLERIEFLESVIINDENPDSEILDEKQLSFLEKLSSQILNNLQLEISDVDISLVEPGVRMTGISVDKMEIFSVDSNWRGSFVHDKATVRKLLNLSNMRVFVDLPNVQQPRTLFSQESISTQLIMKRDKPLSAGGKVLAVDLNLELGVSHVNVRASQLSAISGKRCSRAQKNPNETNTEITRTLSFWRWKRAIKVVIEELQEANEESKRTAFKIACRSIYVDLFKRCLESTSSWLPELNAKEFKRLRLIEKSPKLTLSDILHLRKVAYHEICLETGKSLIDVKTRRQASDYSVSSEKLNSVNNSKQSWFSSWWYGDTKEAQKHLETSIQGSNISKPGAANELNREELFKSIGFSPDDEALMVHSDVQSIKFRVLVNISDTILTLMDENKESEAVARCHLGSIRTDIFFWKKVEDFQLSASSLYVIDPLAEPGKLSKIVAPADNSKQNLLDVRFLRKDETDPGSVNIDFVQPLFIVLPIQFILRVFAVLFDRENNESSSRLSWSEDLTTGQSLVNTEPIRSTFETYRAVYSDYTVHAVTTYSFFGIELTVKAPTIIIPGDMEDTNSIGLCLDLGTLKARNEVDDIGAWKISMSDLRLSQTDNSFLSGTIVSTSRIFDCPCVAVSTKISCLQKTSSDATMEIDLDVSSVSFYLSSEDLGDICRLVSVNLKAFEDYSDRNIGNFHSRKLSVDPNSGFKQLNESRSDALNISPDSLVRELILSKIGLVIQSLDLTLSSEHVTIVCQTSGFHCVRQGRNFDSQIDIVVPALTVKNASDGYIIFGKKSSEINILEARMEHVNSRWSPFFDDYAVRTRLTIAPINACIPQMLLDDLLKTCFSVMSQVNAGLLDYYGSRRASDGQNQDFMWRLNQTSLSVAKDDEYSYSRFKLLLEMRGLFFKLEDKNGDEICTFVLERTSFASSKIGLRIDTIEASIDVLAIRNESARTNFLWALPATHTTSIEPLPNLKCHFSSADGGILQYSSFAASLNMELVSSLLDFVGFIFEFSALSNKVDSSVLQNLSYDEPSASGILAQHGHNLHDGNTDQHALFSKIRLQAQQVDDQLRLEFSDAKGVLFLVDVHSLQFDDGVLSFSELSIFSDSSKLLFVEEQSFDCATRKISIGHVASFIDPGFSRFLDRFLTGIMDLHAMEFSMRNRSASAEKDFIKYCYDAQIGSFSFQINLGNSSQAEYGALCLSLCQVHFANKNLSLGNMTAKILDCKGEAKLLESNKGLDSVIHGGRSESSLSISFNDPITVIDIGIPVVCNVSPRSITFLLRLASLVRQLEKGIENHVTGFVSKKHDGTASENWHFKFSKLTIGLVKDNDVDLMLDLYEGSASLRSNGVADASVKCVSSFNTVPLFIIAHYNSVAENRSLEVDIESLEGLDAEFSITPRNFSRFYRFLSCLPNVEPSPDSLPIVLTLSLPSTVVAIGTVLEDSESILLKDSIGALLRIENMLFVLDEVGCKQVLTFSKLEIRETSLSGNHENEPSFFVISRLKISALSLSKSLGEIASSGTTSIELLDGSLHVVKALKFIKSALHAFSAYDSTAILPIADKHEASKLGNKVSDVGLQSKYNFVAKRVSLKLDLDEHKRNSHGFVTIDISFNGSAVVGRGKDGTPISLEMRQGSLSVVHAFPFEGNDWNVLKCSWGADYGFRTAEGNLPSNQMGLFLEDFILSVPIHRLSSILCVLDGIKEMSIPIFPPKKASEPGVKGVQIVAILIRSEIVLHYARHHPVMRAILADKLSIRGHLNKSDNKYILSHEDDEFGLDAEICEMSLDVFNSRSMSWEPSLEPCFLECHIHPRSKRQTKGGVMVSIASRSAVRFNVHPCHLESQIAAATAIRKVLSLWDEDSESPPAPNFPFEKQYVIDNRCGRNIRVDNEDFVSREKPYFVKLDKMRVTVESGTFSRSVALVPGEIQTINVPFYAIYVDENYVNEEAVSIVIASSIRVYNSSDRSFQLFAARGDSLPTSSSSESFFLLPGKHFYVPSSIVLNFALWVRFTEDDSWTMVYRESPGSADSKDSHEMVKINRSCDALNISVTRQDCFPLTTIEVQPIKKITNSLPVPIVCKFIIQSGELGRSLFPKDQGKILPGETLFYYQRHIIYCSLQVRFSGPSATQYGDPLSLSMHGTHDYVMNAESRKNAPHKVVLEISDQSVIISAKRWLLQTPRLPLSYFNEDEEILFFGNSSDGAGELIGSCGEDSIKLCLSDALRDQRKSCLTSLSLDIPTATNNVFCVPQASKYGLKSFYEFVLSSSQHPTVAATTLCTIYPRIMLLHDVINVTDQHPTLRCMQAGTTQNPVVVSKNGTPFYWFEPYQQPLIQLQAGNSNWSAPIALTRIGETCICISDDLRFRVDVQRSEEIQGSMLIFFRQDSDEDPLYKIENSSMDTLLFNQKGINLKKHENIRKILPYSSTAFGWIRPANEHIVQIRFKDVNDGPVVDIDMAKIGAEKRVHLSKGMLRHSSTAASQSILSSNRPSLVFLQGSLQNLIAAAPESGLETELQRWVSGRSTDWLLRSSNNQGACIEILAICDDESFVSKPKSSLRYGQKIALQCISGDGKKRFLTHYCDPFGEKLAGNEEIFSWSLSSDSVDIKVEENNIFALFGLDAGKNYDGEFIEERSSVFGLALSSSPGFCISAVDQSKAICFGVEKIDSISDTSAFGFCAFHTDSLSELPDRFYFINVDVVDKTHVIRISPSSLEDYGESSQRKNSATTLDVINTHKPSQSEEYSGADISLKLRDVGVSIFSASGRDVFEVLYCSMDFDLRLKLTTLNRRFNFQLRSLHVGNNLRDAIYPVLLSRTPEENDSVHGNIITETPILTMEMEQILTQLNVVYVKTLVFDWGRLDLKTDSSTVDVLENVAAQFRALLSASGKKSQRNFLNVKPSFAEVCSSNAMQPELRAKVFHFREVEFGNIDLTASYYGNRFKDLEGARISLEKLRLQNMTTVFSNLLEEVKTFYLPQLRFQILKSFGHALPGNPGEFFSSVGNESFTRVLAKGVGVLGSLGNTIAKVDGDYSKKRIAAYKPQGLSDALKKSSDSIASGFSRGVEGMWRKPKENMEESGAIGMVTGLGKGLFGLISKPVAGIAAAVDLTTQGLVAETASEDLREAELKSRLRVRPPRYLRGENALYRTTTVSTYDLKQTLLIRKALRLLPLPDSIKDNSQSEEDLDDIRRKLFVNDYFFSGYNLFVLHCTLDVALFSFSESSTAKISEPDRRQITQRNETSPESQGVVDSLDETLKVYVLWFERRFLDSIHDLTTGVHIWTTAFKQPCLHDCEKLFKKAAALRKPDVSHFTVDMKRRLNAVAAHFARNVRLTFSPKRNMTSFASCYNSICQQFAEEDSAVVLEYVVLASRVWRENFLLLVTLIRGYFFNISVLTEWENSQYMEFLEQFEQLIRRIFTG